MKVLIRSTLTGSEYWDTESKRTLFVPKGKNPNFEVTKNPKSMIGNVDLSSSQDVPFETKLDDIPEGNGSSDVGSVTNDIKLEDMNTGQLIVFAEKNDIDVPGTMKKEETIRKHIANALNDSQ